MVEKTRCITYPPEAALCAAFRYSDNGYSNGFYVPHATAELTVSIIATAVPGVGRAAGRVSGAFAQAIMCLCEL